MAVEFPFDLIRKLQATTREEAGLSHYNPDDPVLRRLPTLQEAVSGLDPDAPPYLRCTNCHGKLLRGLQTMVCVYCGSEKPKDGLPLTISFNSTAGCRKLLEALDLDGSEAVMLHADSRDSGKSEGMMKAGLFLSDLLDLKIAWPPEEKGEVKDRSTSKMSTPQYLLPLNVSGTDLDNFFSEPKRAEDSDVFSMPQPVPHVEHISQGSHLFSNFGTIEAFESIQSKDIVQGSAETKVSDIGDSFAEWDADFQLAGSENPVADSKPVDLLQGPPSDLFNKLTEREFSFNNESNDQQIASEVEQHFSTNDSQTPHEFWQSNDIKISDTGAWMKTNTNTTDTFEIKSNNFLAVNELSSGIKLANDSQKNSDNDNDSFNTWQDFTSSQAAPEASSVSWVQIDESSMSSNKHSHELNSQNMIDMLDNMDFSGFSQEVSPGATSVRNDLTNKNLVVTSDGMECSDSYLSSSPLITEVKIDVTDKDKFHTNLTDKMKFIDNFEDMEFGSFSESASSGLKGTKNNPVNKDNIESNAPLADRATMSFDMMSMGGMMENSNSAATATIEPVRIEPVSADVPDLLSQMNDLSFMLESKLSIPEKTKSSDSVP